MNSFETLHGKGFFFFFLISEQDLLKSITKNFNEFPVILEKWKASEGVRNEKRVRLEEKS